MVETERQALATHVWELLHAAYSELAGGATGGNRRELQAVCRAHSATLQWLLDMSHDEIVGFAQRRYARNHVT